MGILIRFSEHKRARASAREPLHGPGSIVILPVVRVDRDADPRPVPPANAESSGPRRRKRPARRS